MAARKPTIAHLLPWPTIGGVEVATIRLIEATRHEFRHVAFCLPESPDLRAACQQAGAEVTTYLPPEPTVRQLARFYRESRLVADELKRQRVDLIHCSDIKAAYHNSLAALLAGKPLISHVRSQCSTLDRRERLTFLPVKHFVFVSEDARRGFALKLQPKRTHILYDGVSFSEEHTAAPSPIREQLGVPQGAPLIGMVARLNPVKDYDTLAAAAALVLAKRPDARFVVIGDNAIVDLNRKHYAYVHQRLVELGIERSFIFTGHRSDVAEIVAALDLFVLCSHREGLPLSILEAMAMGKPVIATSVGGIPEVITHGVTGLLHAHKNSDELAGHILSCIEDPERARRLGQAGRQHCHHAHSAEVFARNAVALYKELLPVAR